MTDIVEIGPRSAVWFITGASSGFGWALAIGALARGYRVVATARDPSMLAALHEIYGERVVTLRLDVTRPEQVDLAIAQGLAAFGQIDVLVNNAGYGYLAAVEEGEEREVRALFDTNFFGMTSVLRAALPHMRARRQGTIVNFSSAGGFVGFPGSGYYAASKFAIEGLSEALAKEVEPLGLRVVVVEPGPFRTEWAGRSLHQSPIHIGDYEATAGARRRRIAANSGTQPGDPQRAAAAIIAAVEADAPPLRLVLGPLAIASARQKLDSVRSDLDRWEDVSNGTDFDPDEDLGAVRSGRR